MHWSSWSYPPPTFQCEWATRHQPKRWNRLSQDGQSKKSYRRGFTNWVRTQPTESGLPVVEQMPEKKRQALTLFSLLLGPCRAVFIKFSKWSLCLLSYSNVALGHLHVTFLHASWVKPLQRGVRKSCKIQPSPFWHLLPWPRVRYLTVPGPLSFLQVYRDWMSLQMNTYPTNHTKEEMNVSNIIITSTLLIHVILWGIPLAINSISGLNVQTHFQQ